MSQERQEIIKCPKCGAEGEFAIWDSINVDLNPELKEKILNEELFLWICPKCGAKVFVPSGTIYHDMKRKYMLFFDFDESKDGAKETEIEIPEMFASLGDYQFRIVHGLMDMKEKIFCLEAGVNDIAVEYMKYMMRHFTYKEEISDEDDIRFGGLCQDEKDGQLLSVFAVLGPEERKGTLELPISIYESCLTKVLSDPRLCTSKGVEVNEKWIESKLKGIC